MEEDDDKPLKTTTTFALVVFLLVLFLSSSALGSDDGEVNDNGDSNIMLEMRSTFTRPPPSWVGDKPCKWKGIGCDGSGRIISINMDSQTVAGNITSRLRDLTNLQSLSAQRNQISGSLPPLYDMPMLQEVFLDDNALSHIDYPFLSNLPSLQKFSIEDNPIDNWSIPDTLSNSTSLLIFHAANASVSGSIPDIFAPMQSLKNLRLSYNDLTGTLPPSLSQISLQNLWINNQKQGLSGELTVLETMTSLVQVWVHANSFVGSVPDLSQCTSLFDLQLRDNHLTGIIPSSISNLTKLVNISLQNNKFQGPMPAFGSNVKVALGNSNSFCLPTPGPCDPQVTILLVIVSDFGYPSALVDSWKGNDACKGWVHVSCNSMGKVSVLNFANLGWYGTISPAFANLTSLTSIILNDNNLYGTIPQALTTLKMLQKLDLSNNNISGKIPNFAKSVTVVLNGNPFFGTNVNTTPSVPPGVLNSGQSVKKPSSQLSASAIIGIVVGVVIVLILLGLVVYRVVNMRQAKIYNEVESLKKRKGKGSKVEDLRMSPIEFSQGSPTEVNSMLNNIQTFSDHGSLIPMEVLGDVTSNFSEKNILGRGGFGIVYKGVLQDGTPIAVKRMESNLQGTKGRSEFEAEIAVLSKVRHRHLVALLGYCVTRNERMVVYEYMPQGTLGQHLFECNDKGFSPLTWKQRLVIALDVARGVEYLHSLAQQSFIHRDLKPSNILLGDNMRAKVSDFGLVKSAPDQGKYSVETRLAGTFGYLAPEYAATGRVTTKVDVFAFGVVLMELITGRKALDERLPEDQAQLVSWFRRVLISKENLRKAIDPHLETDDEGVFDSINKVAELSGHCTTREPQQRPDMSHAVNILSPLVNQWRPAEVDGTDAMDYDDEMSLPQALQRWQAGETTTMSEYSINDSRNYYHSRDDTTPAMDESFTNIQGR